MYFVKQSVQNDSSPLDMNVMSAMPEDSEDPDSKVSDNLPFSTCMVDFSVTLIDTMVLKVAIALTTKPLACGKISIATNITQSTKYRQLYNVLTV